MTSVYPPPAPAYFNADHPFLFALEDNHSGSLLFLGRVTDPSTLAPVPEPASFVAMLAGIIAILAFRWPRIALHA